jgi:hypothetical protein
LGNNGFPAWHLHEIGHSSMVFACRDCLEAGDFGPGIHCL